MKPIFRQLLTFAAGLISLSSCSAKTIHAEAVQPFDINRYLGKWYEIARLDHRFERNMIEVSATYTLNYDGSIAVLNKGYNTRKEMWKSANGKAKFVNRTDVGQLKVSFFGPFYAPYNIVALDKEYQYALIVSKTLDYLWILSRTKDIPETIKQQYLQKAREMGFDTTKLIWVEQNRF